MFTEPQPFAKCWAGGTPSDQDPVSPFNILVKETNVNRQSQFMVRESVFELSSV